MPIIRNGTTDSARVGELTARLADEIRSAHPSGQPVIYENEIAQTGKYHVTVVWDDWARLPLQARSRVILDAYKSADPAKTGKLSIAMGLTQQEAASLGLFPYAIVAALRKSDQEKQQKVNEAIAREGAISGPAGLELRFHTRDEAERALERLQAAVPGPFWVIVQDLLPQR